MSQKVVSAGRGPTIKRPPPAEQQVVEMGSKKNSAASTAVVDGGAGSAGGGGIISASGVKTGSSSNKPHNNSNNATASGGSGVVIMNGGKQNSASSSKMSDRSTSGSSSGKQQLNNDSGGRTSDGGVPPYRKSVSSGGGRGGGRNGGGSRSGGVGRRGEDVGNRGGAHSHHGGDTSKYFMDDSKLSRLMRKLARDDDRDRRLATARQTKDFLIRTENSKIIVKSWDGMMSVFHDIFHERGSRDLKQEIICCMGLLGSMMGTEAHRYFNWIFNKLSSNSVNDDMKNLYLNGLHETLKLDEKKQLLRECIPNIMTNIQSVLENADSCGSLISTVDIILLLSKAYPHIFTTHFRDTVDILVGWHIDSSQRENLTSYTSKSLIALHNFWVADMAFSITLLGQFLEDMEAYAEDLALVVGGQAPVDDEVPPPEDCVDKIAALLRVFSTVVQCISDYLAPGQCSQVNWDYMIDVTTRIVACIQSTMKSRPSIDVNTAGNQCLVSLLHHLQSQIMSCTDLLLPYMINQFNTDLKKPNDYFMSLLQFSQKMVECVNTQLPVSALAEIMGPQSIVHPLIIRKNPKVMTALLNFYRALMGLRSVPLLEEAYSYVLGCLEVALNSLMTDYDFEVKLVAKNPLGEMKYTELEAESAIVFSICVVAEIGNSKSNLIGMWALTPSVFDLFTKHLLKAPPALCQRYPALQFAALQALYSHSVRHGHFILSSALLSRNSSIEGSVIANINPTTSGHFDAVLLVLTEILSADVTPYDSLKLALHWMYDVVEALKNSERVYYMPEFLTVFNEIVQVAYHANEELSLMAFRCLETTLKRAKHLQPDNLYKCLELSLVQLSHPEKMVREVCLKILRLLPLHISTDSSSAAWTRAPDLKEKAETGNISVVTNLANLCRAHMNRIPARTFNSHNFKMILGYILFSMSPKLTEVRTWLKGTYNIGQRSDKNMDRLDHQRVVEKFNSNESLLWFWATWEAAQFCVLAKLRTPLGKPQDTFTSIEATLKKYASETVTNEENSNHTNDSKDGSYCSLLKVHLLLQFMEHLDKLLYNAYEGSAVAIASATKAVRAFFRTNRATCLEWLSRIRLSIILTALHCGQPAMAIRQAQELLRDMIDNNSPVSEQERIVMYLVRGLCELRCPEAVQGVYTWYKELTGHRLTWIKAMVDKAAGKCEQAAVELKSTLKHYVIADNLLPEDTDKSSNSSSPISSPVLGSNERKLSIKNNREPDSNLVSYMVDEVTNCYVHLNSLNEVLDWQETLQNYRKEYTGSNLQSAFTARVDMNYIRALTKFEDYDYNGARESLLLVPGASVTDTDKSITSDGLCWDPQTLIRVCEKRFLAAAVATEQSSDLASDLNRIVDCLNTCREYTGDMLQVAALDGSCPHVHDLIINRHCSATLSEILRGDKESILPLRDELRFETQGHNINSCNTALRLLFFLNNIKNRLPAATLIDFSSMLTKLHLATARLSRKQHNYQLAQRLLLQEMKVSLNKQKSENYREPMMTALSNIHVRNGKLTQVQLIQIERESAKLLHAIGQTRDAVETLATSATYFGGFDVDASPELGELNSRSLLTIVKWFTVDQKGGFGKLVLVGGTPDAGTPLGENNSGKMMRNIDMLLDFEAKGALDRRGIVLDENDVEVLRIGDNPVLLENDAMIGRLLHLSAMQCPTLSKSWFTLANWCYKWGRKAVDNASLGTVELLAEEQETAMSILPKGTSPEETDNVLSVLSQIHSAVNSEEDIRDQDQSLYDDGTETTRKQLLSVCMTLQIAADGCLDRLLDVWRAVVKRVYHYYQLSAKAYFTYLKLNGQGVNDVVNMDGNITATLRLLRLLVKHAWELRGILEVGLAHTPTAPWKGIIPQLFSRLNHPESYVRQSVSDLLCRVAEDAPHLIVYPAVVGCSTRQTVQRDTNRDGLLNNYLAQTGFGEDGLEDGDDNASQDDDADDENIQKEDAMLQNCFTAIVDTLSHFNPKMISDIQLFVEELRRITLLWDELWLGTMNQYHSDVQRRINQLEGEVKKVTSNANLSKEEKDIIIKEKHCIILKPTLYTMERLRDITSRAPETAHERWFHETFGQLIDDALEKLKDPPNPGNPQSSWQLFKQLHNTLQQRSQKRSSLVLKIDQISVKLAEFKNTVIAMPGLSTIGQVVTIESIHNTAQILPTKTKPKKIIFLGSDGKKYPYLFKGLEDLHLDERIMQFLSIVNNMFIKNNREDKRQYHARHYSVTPLGSRSGLIQWVEGATPLFGLYKRWQQRESINQAMKLQQQQQQQQTTAAAGENPPPAPIQRPSEIFYNKLTPLLKEKGISNADNRKDWPVNIMVRVLEELMNDTPKDLLAKELWCSSTSANEWWQITQTFCRQTAVMSMIGYIIGLGDRHLDNILVDLTTGEVVHIDYNVCFEKGRNLRVPEKVPFRMTQNIEAALGLTGVEGTFRLACEHVMKTMRRGRETLLTLLEAFVYDPLVDWTTGNEGGYTGAFYGGWQNAGENWPSKREMDRDITLSMFSIRMAEMKGAWFKNRDEMLGSLPKLRDWLENFLKQQADSVIMKEKLSHLKELTSLLNDAKSDRQHSLFSLKQRYTEFAVVKESQTVVQKAVQDKINECDHWNKLYVYGLQTIQGPSWQRMCTEVSKPLNYGTSSYIPVVAFLQGAGQGQVVIQCEEVDSELSSMLDQRRSLLRLCLDCLHTYTTIVTQLPQSYLNSSRGFAIQHFMQNLVKDFNDVSCKQVLSQYEDKFSDHAISDVVTQNVLNMENKLQALIRDSSNKLLKVFERRNLEGVDTNALGVQVQESANNIQQFIADCGPAGVTSLTAVNVTALCSLTKRYLVMEGAAAAAGDRLMDLTSRDGDWFLDELCSMSGNIQLLIGLLKATPQVMLSESAEMIQSVYQALHTTHMVYQALQDLNANFRNIILPEALKCIQSEETSVIDVIDRFHNLCRSCGHSLEAVTGQLELLVRNAIMGIENHPTEVLNQVKHLRQQYEDLLQGGEECVDLSPGQMLLMGFNGLFTQLDHDFSDMLEAIDSVNVPDIWRKVDFVREARQLQLTAFTGTTMSLLSDLFFIKRLQAMQEFFQLCQQNSQALQGLHGYSNMLCDDDQLAKPVKRFVAEFVRKQVVGLPSQILAYLLCVKLTNLGVNVSAEIELRDIGAECKVSLEDLCKKAVDCSLRQGQFEQVHWTQAGSLLSLHDAAWKKQDLALRLNNQVKMLETSQQYGQLQLARYQWVQEDIFTHAGRSVTQMIIPNRASVMAEMRKSVQALMNLETAVVGLHDNYVQLESGIEQRLKWAAGANPSLNSVLEQFEEATQNRATVVQLDSKLSNEVINICNAVLHFEAVRTRTTDAAACDANFIELITKCEESCLLTNACSIHVTDLEEELVALQALGEKGVTDSWIDSTKRLLDKQINKAQSEEKKAKSAADSSKDAVKGQVSTIRNILSNHHKLMSDIRTILKSMARQEEQEYGTELPPGGVRDYMGMYKIFSETFTTMLKMAMGDEVTMETLAEIDAMIEKLNHQIPGIYDQLLQLAPPLIPESSNAEGEQKSFAAALKKPIKESTTVESTPGSNVKKSEPSSMTSLISKPPVTSTPRKQEKITRDPRTGKAIQERNSYAVGVWRKVKMKLDGRDPDVNKRLSVAEQVDIVIKEAKNVENLSLLYEGWTPWV